MGPISGVNAGTGGLAEYRPPVVPAADGRPGAGLNSDGLSVLASSVTSSSVTITTVQTAVAQALQNIDEDLANNELLQMVIALLILMAILQQAHPTGESADQALKDFSPGSDGRPAYFVGYAASTTIEIQQSVSTSVALGTFGANGALTGEQEQPGGRIDISA